VDDYAYALDDGATFPPPVIDRATMKIADGFHRTRAYRKRLGNDGMIEVEFEEFADDLAIMDYSARVNRVHGLPLGRHDQRVVHLKMKALGASDEDVAGALGVTVTRLRVIVVPIAKSDAGDIALKGGTKHLAGVYLTDEQRQEINRMRGGPARAKANELARLLRQDLANVKNDPELRSALAELAAAIQEALAPFGG
jgi:hypothetical protein